MRLLGNHEHTVLDRLCIVIGYTMVTLGALSFFWAAFSSNLTLLLLSAAAIVIGFLIGRNYKLLSFIQEILH